MFKKYRTLLLVLLLFFASSNMFAQSCPPGCRPHPTRPGVCIGPSCPPGPPGLPIDGGLGFLLLAGVAYGVKRLRRKE